MKYYEPFDQKVCLVGDSLHLWDPMGFIPPIWESLFPSASWRVAGSKIRGTTKYIPQKFHNKGAPGPNKELQKGPNKNGRPTIKSCKEQESYLFHLLVLHFVKKTTVGLSFYKSHISNFMPQQKASKGTFIRGLIRSCFSWHILGDRLIPEQLLWVDRGILHVTH